MRGSKPATKPALRLRSDSLAVQIVLLDEAVSLALWKENWQGEDRVFLTRAGLVIEGDSLRLTSTNAADLSVSVLPAPPAVMSGSDRFKSRSDGVFRRFTPARPKSVAFKVGLEKVQPAEPDRLIPLGKIQKPVAEAPEDADFTNAAIWRVQLPANLDLDLNPILRLQCVGDAARVSLGGRLLTDDFYNGNALETGLHCHAPEISDRCIACGHPPLAQRRVDISA